jgi:transposase-like protein
VGLVVADGIVGLDTVVGERFPEKKLPCSAMSYLSEAKHVCARVRHGDKAALASDLRDVFRTGQRDYTVDMAWKALQNLCDRWGKDYISIRRLRNNADYKVYMTYLNYSPEIHSMIYTTHRIERINRDFRRVTKMRTAIPNEEFVITLMGSVAMDHKPFERILPRIIMN